MEDTIISIFITLCICYAVFFMGILIFKKPKKNSNIRRKAEVLLSVLQLDIYENICDAYTKIYREPYFSSELYKEMIVFCKENNINGVLFKLRKEDAIDLLNKMIKSSWER